MLIMVPHRMLRYQKASDEKWYKTQMCRLQGSLQRRFFGLFLLGFTCKDNRICFDRTCRIRSPIVSGNTINEKTWASLHKDAKLEGLRERYAHKGVLDKWLRFARSLASTLWTVFAISLATKCSSWDHNSQKTGSDG